MPNGPFHFADDLAALVEALFPGPGEELVQAWRAVEDREVSPVRFEQWRTQQDERVCPECGPLAGQVFEAGTGPYPPLHVNCRCTRVFHHTEWRSRPVTTWELTWVLPNLNPWS